MIFVSLAHLSVKDKRKIYFCLRIFEIKNIKGNLVTRSRDLKI